MKTDDYDPFDIYADLEKERLEILAKKKEVTQNAVNEKRSGSNEKHEEAVREEEGKGRILRLDKQEEGRVKQVAPIKRKRGRSKKVK